MKKPAEKTPAKEHIQVLIIHDYRIIRNGLKMLLTSLQKKMHFKITEASSGGEALRKINRQDIDLVMMDCQLTDMPGTEMVHCILRYKPEMKILVFSSDATTENIRNMMDAGAKGFVLKSIETEEMLNAVKTILADKIYYCSEVAVKLIHPEPDRPSNHLTEREREVLGMIVKEMTNEEIAKKLFLSKRTIDTHRQNLISKLRVKNTVGLVKAAFNMNLL